MFADLHTHTLASDGTLSSQELIEEAIEKGIEIISITDHDTVDGLLNIKLMPDIFFIYGVEISAEYPRTLHILGYGIDPNNEKLRGTLKELQEYRKKRNEIMVQKMNNIGFQITLEELLEEAGNEIVGRPHFASLMVKKGYVSNYQEAFDKYLKKGAPIYVDKKRLSAEQAIELINAAGGISVLAHPYQSEAEVGKLESLLEELIGYGLQGIEVFYSKHTKKQTELYLSLAKKYDLLITAGTDFHGDNKPDISLGIEVKYSYIRNFLCKLR